MKPLAPNTMIQNRYLIVQPIGKGGMGEVYLAVDQRLGSAVALKRTFFRQDEELGSAFEREARILARLRHPVLPKVIDHFTENGDQFLIMEHISGDDLAKRLENAAKPFPLSWVMFWADQLLDALAYLHSHEPPIIHRDIKPQNLKLTDENHIVLLDFGLSKDFDSRSTSQPMNSGSVVGYSPFFASMEQVRGTGTDARSDIYSLSATLYQLLTNTVPPDSLARADILLSGASDPIIPLNEINPDVPSVISDVILKGIAVRQNERFANAVEMQKALRRGFGQEKPNVGEKTAVMESPTPTVAAPAPPAAEAEISEMATKTHFDTSGIEVDATLQMSGSLTAEPAKQSELKTEVFTTAPEIGSLKAAPPADSGIDAPGNGLPVAVAQANPAPATIPSSVPAALPIAASAKTHPGGPPPAKKSSSKMGLVAGVLIALVLLGGLVAGGGWYAYKNYYTSAKPPVLPSPSPSAATSPSPSPTVLVEANQDTNGNTNSVQVSDSNTADKEANRTTIPSSTPETVVTRTTPQTAPKNVLPRNTQLPAVKATPKPKQRDERTIIVQ